MSLSASRNSTKAPAPPAMTAASRGIVLQPVLSLMIDPATSSQYGRHATQLNALLQASKTGFNAQVARDGLPQVLAFIKDAVLRAQPGSEVLHAPLMTLLQHCAIPIVCTTLNDQRVLVDAIDGMLRGVASLLELPDHDLRVTAATVLRQIFATLRAQCFDDVNPNPNATFHKKKDLDKAITPALVQSLVAAWSRTVEAEVSAVFEAETASGRKQVADTHSSDDDETTEPPAKTRPRNYEMIVILKALLELSNYRRLCEVLLRDGVDLSMSTLQLCSAGDVRIPLAVELIWNVLSLCPYAAAQIGQRRHLAALHTILVDTLSVGFKLQERELRNDIVVVLNLLAKERAVVHHFTRDLIELLLVLGCGLESGRRHPAVNPTYHASNQDEDLQLKFLVWDTLSALCRNADIAAHIFNWGLYDVLLAYVNVNCEIPAVVSWSTLQVLDIQSHVLNVINDLMDRGCTWFAKCSGPATIRSYIDECPKVSLRNEALSVLTSAAATAVRRDLVGIGAIPLAIRLLEETSDLDLSISCLNMLSDVVRRDPMLQRQFDEHDGIRVVLPLLTFKPNEYTDLLHEVIFAAVDCMWQCVFGSETNVRHLVDNAGISALLTVLETCPAWMVSLPLSCLADLMQHPGAAHQCREWRSPRTGRSGVQIALSFWSMAPLDTAPAVEAVASNKHIGLEAIGVNTHQPLTRAPAGTETTAEDDFNIAALDVRLTIREPPSDIAHVVDTQKTNFKVFAFLSMLGFDGHSELDAEERATLAAVDQFIALCKDEVWENVEESLSLEGITPIAADLEILRAMRAEAQVRSTNLLATRQAYEQIQSKRTEESERTFYHSLIKKNEERTVSASKPMGLSITEAKIRKAQMLKASFKQAVGQTSSATSQARLNGDDLKVHRPTATGETAAEGAHPQNERWDPGQRAMRDDEYEILRVLNDVRTNPSSLIPAIEEKLRYLDETGSTFYAPGCDPETCVEGESAYREAIEFLRQVRPLVTLLDVPIGIVYAARDHVVDLSGRMDVSQDGSDKSTPHSRLQRYGRVGRFSQLTALGQRSALGIVIQLIVDDGVSSRIDRQSIFDPDAHLCGLSVGPHSIHDTVSVIMLAYEYTEKSAEEQIKVHEAVQRQHASRK
jgi:hypothetical protein